MTLSNLGRHLPVLVDDVLAGLNVDPAGIYVDGTFGRGGHSAAILKQLGSEGRLLAIDQDAAALASADQPPFKADERFTIVHQRFDMLTACLAKQGWGGQVAGVLLDLGVSSPQLDDASRGFSFQSDGPLDMRMNTSEGIPTAAAWLSDVSQDELCDVIRRYGEERFAKRIARRIVEMRVKTAITTTGQLAEIVKRCVPGYSKIHPATRTFQAIRIHINDELGALERVLPQLMQALRPGGRLAVISFHSLEDRIVKRFIRQYSETIYDEPLLNGVTGHVTYPVLQGAGLKRLGKAIKADAAACAVNPRARSARLRIAERC